MNFKKTYIWLPILAIVGLVIVTLLSANNEILTEIKSSEYTSPVDAKKITEKLIFGSRPPELQKQGGMGVITTEEKEALREWRREHGYGRGMEPNDTEYDSYSIETLEKLVQSNDIRAMNQLANKLYGMHNKGYESAKAMHELAAVHGSTKALNAIAHKTMISKVMRAEKEGLSIEQKRELWVDVLSWYLLARMRGDNEYVSSLLPAHLETYNANLLPEDWQSARDKAGAMYESLQQKRLALGLEPFDNSVPDAVKKWNDFLLSTASFTQYLD